MRVVPVFKCIEHTLPNGTKVNLYPINVLAEELGRTSQCIRQWEVAGILPPPIFKKGDLRLYTREQIDIISECACKAKLQKGRSIAKTSFSKNCHAKLAELNKKYVSK